MQYRNTEPLSHRKLPLKGKTVATQRGREARASKTGGMEEREGVETEVKGGKEVGDNSAVRPAGALVDQDTFQITPGGIIQEEVS